jgi:hypothetical protein
LEAPKRKSSGDADHRLAGAREHISAEAVCRSHQSARRLNRLKCTRGEAKVAGMRPVVPDEWPGAPGQDLARGRAAARQPASEERKPEMPGGSSRVTRRRPHGGDPVARVAPGAAPLS